MIASRNDAKSFIVATYAVARCLLYKGTKFRIGAATEKQAKLIVSEKIIDELCEWSPILKKEIVLNIITIIVLVLSVAFIIWR